MANTPCLRATKRIGSHDDLPSLRLSLALVLLLSAGSGPPGRRATSSRRRASLLTRHDQVPARAGDVARDRRAGRLASSRSGWASTASARGGGLSEVWARTIPTKPSVRVPTAASRPTLTGTSRNLGGVERPHRRFQWTSERPLHRPRTSAAATVSGSARSEGGRVISRCKIAEPATVRLRRALAGGEVFSAVAPIGACPTPPRSCSSRTTRSIRTFLADNLTADGYELLVADDARGRAARSSSHSARTSRSSTSGCPDGSGLELDPAGARGGRGRLAARPDAAAASMLSGSGRRAGPRARASSAAPTTTSPSRSPTASCGCGSRRCCAARTSARAARAAARGGAGDRPGRRARRGCAGSGSSSRRRSSRCCATLASAPTRVFTKDELLRDVWGFRAARRDAHAGLPRLPAAAEARARTATSSSSTSGASATGSSTARPRREAA